MTPMFAMAVDPWILAFSAITVGATIFMGFWTARKSKTASDFFVAGRSVSVGWNASAISGEYLSAASFMGIAGMVMSSGYDALWYPVCYACGYLFLLLFIAGPLRRFGAYTIPDFAEGRFDSPVFRKIAVCFVLFIGFFYTMPQMKGAGVTLAYIFPGLPYWVGVVLVGAVITLNVALGGMKGITLVQAVQYWAKMFAISVPIFVLMAVYGHYGKQLEMNESQSKHHHLMNEPEVRTQVQLPMFSAPIEAVNGFIPYRPFGASGAGQFGAKGLSVGELTTRVKAFDSPYASRKKKAQAGSGLDTAISEYARQTRKTIWLHAGIDLKTPGEFLLNPTDSAATIQSIEAFLAAKGLVIQDHPRFGIRIAPAAIFASVATTAQPISISETSIRKAALEKAPADSTWLSPFGPLTTKAAKAAKPDPRYTGPLLVNAFGSAFENVAGRLLDQLSGTSGAGNFKFDPELVVSFPPTNRSAFELVLTSTMERQYTRRISEIRYSPELTNLFIYWPPATQEIKAKDFSKTLPSVLSSNGVTVVEEGSVVTAFLTKDAKIVPIDPRPYSLLYTYSLIIALVCGTAGLPHILVRFYTNPDGVAAKRTTMWVMILIGIFYVFPPVFGVMGRNLFPELYSGIGAKGTDKIVLELPRLLNAKYAPLGSILSGITCAGAFAAFMSTFSGLLVSMTGAMAHDVYGRMLRPKSTPNERMRMFKVFAVVLGGVAMLLGSFVEPLEINFMVGQAFAIAAASYFPLLFMAVWWRQLTMKGAATGMLVGGLSAVGAISLTSFSTLALAPGRSGELFAVFKPLNTFWAGHPLLRILCEQPAIWAVPLAIGLMIVVSKLTRDEVPSDIRMKMLVLHAPEKLGLKQEYIQEHQHGH